MRRRRIAEQKEFHLGHQVLFVDDEAALLAGLRFALRKERFEILTASSGDAGLALLAQQEVDVVVSDEQMPGMAGSQFLAKLRTLYPRTARIILSGQATVEADIRAINEGETYRFLTKPCNPAQLARESQKLLSAVRMRRGILDDLEVEHPGITRRERTSSGAFVLQEETDPSTLIQAIRAEMGGKSTQTRMTEPKPRNAPQPSPAKDEITVT